MTAQGFASQDTVILSPSFRLPLGLGAIAVGIGLWNAWVALPLMIFALFLAIQAAWLRIHFTTTAFDVYRGKRLIRSFPYDQWINWEIYWFFIPILLYFKEIRSIHFLPILFDPTRLKRCLEQNCVIEKPATQPTGASK